STNPTPTETHTLSLHDALPIFITDQPFDDKQRWIELRVPKAETRVVLFTTDEDKERIGTFMNMSYTCEDLQKTYEELQKRGVERSEEHTSELQSLAYLVCRLLL